MLRDVAGLSFRYFGAPEAGAASLWVDEWASEALPELVEMQVRRSRPTSSGPLVFRVALRLRPNR